MRTGRPRKPIILADEERKYMESLLRKGSTPQKIARRVKIILMSADDIPNIEIGKRLGITQQTVSHWRMRFLKFRLSAIDDAPRSGAPRTIGDDKVAEIINKTLHSMPKGQTHWSTRGMGSETGVSHSTVGRIWRAFGLKPHRKETFQLSTDPQFVEKVRDVVGLYMNPPDGALVLSVDEKPQIQALKRTQPVVGVQIAQVERKTSEYERKGTTNLFAALNVKTGQVHGKCFQRKRSREFVNFLKELDRNVDGKAELHIILDNSSIHKSPETKQWLLRHPRFHLHFTPTHSSWLNQIELWFSLLQRRQLDRGVYSSVSALEDGIFEYIEHTNDNPKPFIWTKTADQILGKVARFCHRTLEFYNAKL